MDLKEWSKFLDQKKQGTDNTKLAYKEAKGWSSCAIGCRLQKEFGKTGGELEKLNDRNDASLKTLLSKRAEVLGLDFYELLKKDSGSREYVSYGALKGLFDEIQALTSEELFDQSMKEELKSYYN